MLRCSKCHRPLTEFELAFHAKARSNSTVQTQCWCCSGASAAFQGKSFFDRSLQIKCCWIGYAIFAFGMILYGLSSQSSLGQQIGPILAIFVSGIIPSISIFFFSKKYDDPNERHYDTSYSSSSYYESRINGQGNIITEKVNTSSSSTNNNWSDWKTKPLVVQIIFIIYGFTFLWAFFPIWGLPYIIYTTVKSKPNHIPPHVFNAYKEAFETTKTPITFHHKVKFLLNREKLTQTQKKKDSDFFNQYRPSQENSPAFPYAFVKKEGTSYMIVDYKNILYGVSFVLQREQNGKIYHKMITQSSFVVAEEDNWKEDWKNEGAKEDVINNINRYYTILYQLS